MDFFSRFIDIERLFVYYENRISDNHSGRKANRISDEKRKADEKMTIDELAREYNEQYRIICAKMDGLRPLLSVCGGEDLYRLRRKLKTYYDMACECRHIASILSGYYEEDEKE